MAPPFSSPEMSCHHYWSKENQPGGIGLQFTRREEGGGIVLNQVNSEKDIGVIIESNLTFREHMTEKVNKANRVMGVIRRTYTYLNESTFFSL